MNEETKKHIVFVESREFIDSAVSFSQYIFDGKRLITIIGELHTTPFKCPEPSITIAQYCKNAVTRNVNCRVLLEYNKSDNVCPPSEWSECEVLRTTYNELKESNESQMIPSDIRPSFITRQGQNMLYGLHTRMDPTHMDQEYKYIRENFVNPFIAHFDINNIEIDLRHHKQTTKFLLEKEFHPDIYNFFKYYYFYFILNPFIIIHKLIREKQEIYLPDGREIQGSIYEKLKEAWAAVSDFFIMKSLLKINNKINEYILIVGDNHRKNIQRSFEYINDKIKTQKNVLDLHELDESLLKESILHKLNDHTPKNERDCATVFQTYIF
jgi:hypothetical protein